MTTRSSNASSQVVEFSSVSFSLFLFIFGLTRYKYSAFLLVLYVHPGCHLFGFPESLCFSFRSQIRPWLSDHTSHLISSCFYAELDTTQVLSWPFLRVGIKQDCLRKRVQFFCPERSALLCYEWQAYQVCRHHIGQCQFCSGNSGWESFSPKIVINFMALILTKILESLSEVLALFSIFSYSLNPCSIASFFGPQLASWSSLFIPCQVTFIYNLAGIRSAAAVEDVPFYNYGMVSQLDELNLVALGTFDFPFSLPLETFMNI